MMTQDFPCHFYGKIKFAISGFTWEEFMEFIEDYNEYINFFAI